MGYNERVGHEGILGFGGLDLSRSEIALEPHMSPDLMNVDLHPIGSCRKRSGYAVQSTISGSGTPHSIFRGRVGDGTAKYYAHVGSAILRADTTAGPWSGASTAAGLTIDGDNRHHMIQGRYSTGPSVFMCNGVEKPKIATMNATLASDLIDWPAGAYGDGSPGSGTRGYPSTWATDWPAAMAMANIGLGSDARRCLAWGFDDEPGRIDYSELGIPWNFLRSNVDDATATAEDEIDGGSFYVGRGDGDEIIGVVAMFGYLIVFKKLRTFVLVGDPGQATFTVHNVFDAGCLSRRSIVRIGNDILFWSRTGPRSLAYVRERGDITLGDGGDIGHRVHPEAEGVASSAHEEIVAQHDEENNRVLWFFPSAGNATNNRAIIYYYDAPRWTRYDGAYTQIADVITVTAADAAAQAVVAVNSSGECVTLASGQQDDETSIEAYHITAWMNFGDISDATRSLWLEVMYGDAGAGDSSIQYQADFGTDWTTIDDIVKSFGGEGALWDHVDWDDFFWDEAGRAYNRYSFSALFNFVRLKFLSSADYNFEILGHKMELRQKGARA